MNFVARRNCLSDILCIVHKNMTNVFSEKGQSVVNANTLFENLNTDTRNIYFESFLKFYLKNKNFRRFVHQWSVARQSSCVVIVWQ